jgi:predicted dehydrogenase
MATTRTTDIDEFSHLSLPYRPQDPIDKSPGIGLVGCGGISRHHLAAYAAAGYNVVALCDVDRDKAVAQRDKFFPAAQVTTTHQALIDLDTVQVVDVTTHPQVRPPIIADALRAGKHVLSQKPFVLELDQGERLAALADAHGVLLAVNQNGRWAPHFSYMRQVVAAGWLGQLAGLHFRAHWNHSWVKGLAFEKIRHLILYDYAIHWFDMLATLMHPYPARRVYASFTPGPTPPVEANLFAQVVVEYDDAQASLVFDGHTQFAEQHSTVLVGTRGTLHSVGPDENQQQLQVALAGGIWQPVLEGRWFDDGFHGAMGELLRAVEGKYQPSHNARDNLASLALCFAAVESAERNQPVVPGTVRSIVDC